MSGVTSRLVRRCSGKTPSVPLLREWMDDGKDWCRDSMMECGMDGVSQARWIGR